MQMISSTQYVLRYEVSEKKSVHNKGTYNGIDYQSESFHIPKESHLSRIIIHTRKIIHHLIHDNKLNHMNVPNNTENQNLQKFIDKYYSFNEKTSYMTGLSIPSSNVVDSSSLLTSSHNQFIPFQFRRSVSNSSTTSIDANSQTDYRKVHIDSNGNNLYLKVEPQNDSNHRNESMIVSVISKSSDICDNSKIIKSTNTNIMTSSASLVSLELTSITSHNNGSETSLLIKNKIIIEEDIICVTRGLDKIEVFELKGLVSLQSLPNPKSFQYHSKDDNNKSSSLLTHVTPLLHSYTDINPNVMKTPNINNPISSLFDDIFMTANDTSSALDNHIHKVKKDSLQYSISMSGTPNSVSKIEVNKKFVKVSDEADKNNDFVIGSENCYSIDTIDLNKEFLLSSTNYDTTNANANAISSTSTKLVVDQNNNRNIIPLLKYTLAPNFKFLILKANSDVVVSTPEAADPAVSTSLTSSPSSLLKISVQVRLNPNFKEKLVDFYVLASIKKLLYQQSSSSSMVETKRSKTLSNFCINDVKQISPRGVYNKNDHIITWSSVNGVAEPGSVLNFSAIIEIGKFVFNTASNTTNNTDPVTAATTGSLQDSSASNGQISSETEEYNLYTSSVPLIVKGKYQNAIITKTRFHINEVINEYEKIPSEMMQNEEIYRTKVEYRFLENL